MIYFDSGSATERLGAAEQPHEFATAVTAIFRKATIVTHETTSQGIRAMDTAAAKYPGKLFLADEDGNYLGLSRKFDVHITDDSVVLSEISIPLLKIQRAERLGSGARLLYFDAKGMLNRLHLTTSDLFGIGRKEKIHAFLSAVNTAIADAKKDAPPEVVIAAQKSAPSDTCHDCHERGGAPGTFGTIFSFLVYAQWSTREGVFCKKHATSHGLNALVVTALLGWWSLRGLIFAPFYTFMNVCSLWRHSTLRKPAIVALAVVAFAPGLLIATFIVRSAML